MTNAIWHGELPEPEEGEEATVESAKEAIGTTADKIQSGELSGQLSAVQAMRERAMARQEAAGD